MTTYKLTDSLGRTITSGSSRDCFKWLFNQHPFVPVCDLIMAGFKVLPAYAER